MSIRKRNRAKVYKSAAGGKSLSKTYRNRLEELAAQTITRVLGKDKLKYEPYRLRYTQPAVERDYLPDFILPNGIIIETKGIMENEDRKKYVHLKNEYPDLDLRFVFSRSKTPVRKGAKMTYADWCVNNGFPYADKTIPSEWLTEPNNMASMRALLKAALKHKNRQLKSKRRKKK